MSIQSWMAEYYPVSGTEIARKGTQASLEHGLLKFQGTLPENLARHGLVLNGVFIEDLMGTRMFTLGWQACGLCWIYQSSSGPLGVDFDCEGCPLYSENEEGVGNTCYDDGRGWDLLKFGEGPHVMIEELKAALEAWKQSGVIEEWAQEEGDD